MDIKDSIITGNFRSLWPALNMMNKPFIYHIVNDFLFWSFGRNVLKEYVCVEPWMAEAGNFPNNEGVVELTPGQTMEAECSFLLIRSVKCWC